jgi:hypothetical protein
LLYQLHHGSTTQKIRVSGVPLELALNSTFFLKQSSWIYSCLASEVGRELEKGGVDQSKYDLRVIGLCLLCLAANKPTPRVSPPLESIVVFSDMGKDGRRGASLVPHATVVSRWRTLEPSVHALVELTTIVDSCLGGSSLNLSSASRI